MQNQPNYCNLTTYQITSVVVVVFEESPYPRGPICKSLSFDIKSLSLDLKSLSFDHKVLEHFQGLRVLQTVRYVHGYRYDHATSINLVSATEHEDTVKNVLLTDVIYYLLI